MTESSAYPLLVFATKFGVGVVPGKGVYRPDAPALGAGRSMTAFIKAAGVDLAHGVRHMVQEVRSGQIIPALVSAWRARAK